MPRQKKQRLKQRADGRYACRYRDQWFYGDSDDEALAKRDDYIRQERAGEYVRADPTVSEYAQKWLPLHKSGVSDKCYNDYAKQLEALCAVIGSQKLKKVAVDDAAAVWDHYKGYSASTIKRARMLFVALFDSAIENDLIRKNPFRGRFAQPPKGTQGSHRALTDEEIELVRETPHRMQCAALIMLYAGLRRGEVLALTRDDLIGVYKHYKRITRFENRRITFKIQSLFFGSEIRVDKSIRFNGNTPEIQLPKTKAGIRNVPMLSILQPYLRKPKQQIIGNASGKVMTEQSFSRCWESYILHLSKAAGHPVNIRPHDLRHTYCTMLRDAGVDMHQAMLWLGHADEKMILHVYDHINEKRTQNSINQVEKTLFGSQFGSQTENVP